mmetsp:Transcript_21123/g.39708  ORF Transcript_21123/g.39708 Transcript_21123/m.39708 type:complete len:165 (+) Transcript_21123:87-581(+)
MGCAASSAVYAETAQPGDEGAEGHGFGDVEEAMKRFRLEGAKGEQGQRHMQRRSRLAGPTKSSSLEFTTQDWSDLGGRMDVEEVEACAGNFSSWDSDAWNRANHRQAVPPNRRLHERHVAKVDAFEELIRICPEMLEESVESRRKRAGAMSQLNVEPQVPEILC